MRTGGCQRDFPLRSTPSHPGLLSAIVFKQAWRLWNLFFSGYAWLECRPPLLPTLSPSFVSVSLIEFAFQTFFYSFFSSPSVSYFFAKRPPPPPAHKVLSHASVFCFFPSTLPFAPHQLNSLGRDAWASPPLSID